ncbi:MAG TPA: YciI family protein [Solirubrobacterales bacterium]|jgi:hypothetical protein|nr:YciI family protein [Solirubrobacterales bacterium]
MIIRRADADTEAGVMPSEELLREMGNYMEEMVKAGVMLAGEGLQPTSKATLVDFQDGQPQITDGPFAEAKELIAGFCIIQAKSKEEALEWVKRWPAELDNNPTIEIRQVFEDDDFGEEFTPELREREERLRAESGNYGA